MANERELHRRLLAESLSERFGLALIDGDASAAEHVARHAVDEGLSHAVIGASIVTPAMHRIGVMWERGEIGVAHEHAATQISLRVLALLRELFRVAHGRGDQRVILAAVQGEQHFVGLQMAADLLEESGYDTVMLGPDVPTGALADVVEEHRPQIVALTSTMVSSVGQLPRTIDAVRTASPVTGVIAGGVRGPRRVPAAADVAYAGTVLDVVEIADALVRRPSLN